MKLKSAMLAALLLAALPFAGIGYAADSIEAQCKAEAAEDGVTAEEMKSYIEACMKDKKQAAAEKQSGSGDS